MERVRGESRDSAQVAVMVLAFRIGYGPRSTSLKDVLTENVIEGQLLIESAQNESGTLSVNCLISTGAKIKLRETSK
jgi:hypothetical protein